MATFQKLGSGKIQARIRKRGKDTSQVFETLATAKKWAKREAVALDASIFGGGSFNRQSFSVGDACIFYFENHVKGMKSEKEYRYVMANLPSFLVGERISTLTREPGERYIAKLIADKLNPATIHRRIGVVRSAINFSIKTEVSLSGLVNPFVSIKLPKLLRTASRDRITNDDEMNEFFKRITKRSKSLSDYMILALETASRRAEITSLRWENVHFDKSIAHLIDTKNGTERDVPLSPVALETLEKRKKEIGTEWVFPSPFDNKKPITPASISLAFRRIRKQIEEDTGKKLDLRIHDLRHTSATKWAEIFDSFDLQKITGHLDIRSMKRYVHKDAKKIAEKMKGL